MIRKFKTSEGLVLKPTNDFRYLYKLFLQYKYKPELTKEQFMKIINDFCHSAWKIFYKNINYPLGVVLIQKVNNMYTLDGYRDDINYKKSELKISTSYLAGKTITDYVLKELDNKIYSMHRIENRGADILCRKMGFKKQNIFIDKETDNKFNVYLKEK